MTVYSHTMRLKDAPRIPFEHFLLSRKIAEGGDGSQIYRGINQRDQRHVVVKMHERDQGLYDEAYIHSQFDHPNIVKGYDFGVGLFDDRQVEYLELEDAKNGTLESSPPDTTITTLRYLVETARALEHVHDKGYVHNDGKETNIFLQQADTHSSVRLGDFGHTTDVAYTPLDISPGTEGYRAPQQIQGILIPQNDIFTLGGIIAYRLATGYEPFPALETLESGTTGLIVPPTPQPFRNVLGENMTVYDEVIEESVHWALYAKSGKTAGAYIDRLTEGYQRARETKVKDKKTIL